MCEYCNVDENGDDIAENVIEFERQGAFDLMKFLVWINASKKKLILFGGTENNADTLSQREIHYCPMCGRKLGE